MKIRNFVFGVVAAATLGSASAAVYTVQFDYNSAADPTITLDGQTVTNPGLSFLDGYSANVAALLPVGNVYSIDTIFTNPAANNVLQHVTVTRSADNTFSSYIDGTLDYSFNDSSQEFVFKPGSGLSEFAKSVVAQGYDRTPGTSTSYLTLYDYALPSGQVPNLSAVPEPESVALLLAGLATVGVVARRRRAAA